MKKYEVVSDEIVKNFNKKITETNKTYLEVANKTSKEKKDDLDSLVKKDQNIQQQFSKLVSKSSGQFVSLIDEDIPAKEKVEKLKETAKKIEDGKLKRECFIILKKISNSINSTEKNIKSSSHNEKNKEYSKAQSKISKQRIGDEKFRNLAPHSNDLTSFSRLLQMNFFQDEPCVTLFYDKDKDILFYSTNKNSNLNTEIPNQSKLLKNFFQKVVERLAKCNQINSNSEDEKIKKVIQIRNDFIQLQKNEKVGEKEIIKKIIDYCREIVCLAKSDSFEDYKNIKRAVLEAAIYSYDILRFYDILTEKKEATIELSCSEKITDSNIIAKLKKFELEKAKFITQNSESSDVHCECKMIEHFFESADREENLENIFKNFAENVENKNITISKFCCLFCHLVFSAIGEKTEKKEAFNKLGNSGLVFSNWKSPTTEAKKKEWEPLLQEIKKTAEGYVNKSLIHSLQKYQSDLNSDEEQKDELLVIIENSNLLSLG